MISRYAIALATTRKLLSFTGSQHYCFRFSQSRIAISIYIELRLRPRGRRVASTLRYTATHKVSRRHRISSLKRSPDMFGKGKAIAFSNFIRS